MSFLGKFLSRMAFGQVEVRTNEKSTKVSTEDSILDIGHIKGHEAIKVGLLIAATGRHNILLVGPPGEGKSTIASTLPGFSFIGDSKDDTYDSLCNTYIGVDRDHLLELPPFIEVGPNITESGLLGGGRVLHHGAITNADRGILFMDEFPQFNRGLLESLRTPMERCEINISRGGVTKVFPCDFQLVASMNPCLCGYYGTPKCTCTDNSINRYLSKLSGPILDRIDLFLYMDTLGMEDRFKPSIIGQTEQFRRKVHNAIKFRLCGRGQYYPNKAIHSKDVYNPKSDILRYSDSGLHSFKLLMSRDGFSTRKGVRLARLARSMADLLQHTHIEQKHLLMVEDYLSPPSGVLE